MRILSFGWTVDKLLAGKKTVTRRRWKKAWVKPDDLVQAWDKGPHRGGRRLGYLRILSIEKEQLDLENMSDREARKEGFRWRAFVELLKSHGFKTGDKVYRIEFEPVGKLK